MPAVLSNSLRREQKNDMLSQYRNAADSLAKAQDGLLASKEALNRLGQRFAAAQLVGFISYIGQTRRLLHEHLAEMSGEAVASSIFEVPLVPRPRGRPCTKLNI